MAYLTHEFKTAFIKKYYVLNWNYFVTCILVFTFKNVQNEQG